MGKYSDQLRSKNVTSPDNKLVAIDENYVTKEPTTYKINFEEKLSDNYKILDSNDKECYIVKKKTFGDVAICNLNEEPLILIKDDFTLKILKYEKEGKKVIAKVEYKATMKHNKYEVKFKNISTGKDETLCLNGSSTYNTVGVFNGKEKEGAPMISRMQNTINVSSFFNYKGQFTIEIAPNVDSLLMIALGLFISLTKINDKDSDDIFHALMFTRFLRIIH